MQVNLIANSPDFADLATTGYWGTYYGDEELARWSFMLMRHYAVEGHKDMLSARYGFKYNPGFLANGDFADGLNGWTVSPAAEGSIRTDTIAGYGKNSQGRWGGGKAGDTVCVHDPQRRQAQPHQPDRAGPGSRQGLLPAVRHRRPSRTSSARSTTRAATASRRNWKVPRSSPTRASSISTGATAAATTTTTMSPRSTSTASSSAPSPQPRSSPSTMPAPTRRGTHHQLHPAQTLPAHS